MTAIRNLERALPDAIALAHRLRARVLIGALCIAACPVGAAATPPPDGAPKASAVCQLPGGTERGVVAIIDGETLRLDDGRELRLLGILAPRATDAATSAADAWPPAASAKAALAQLAQGQRVRIATAGQQRDRYARIVAHAFVRGSDGSERWLQGDLLANGHARAHFSGGDTPCSEALVAAEGHARGSGIGLWAHAAYKPKPAWQSRILSRSPGTYQIVEGKVRRAERKGERIHLYFGRDMRSDFTIVVAAELARGEPAWTASLLDAAGRTVRVRGWIAMSNGPMIEATHPAQIEILDGPR